MVFVLAPTMCGHSRQLEKVNHTNIYQLGRRALGSPDKGALLPFSCCLGGWNDVIHLSILLPPYRQSLEIYSVVMSSSPSSSENKEEALKDVNFSNMPTLVRSRLTWFARA